jgi:hypothetical protein
LTWGEIVFFEEGVKGEGDGEGGDSLAVIQVHPLTPSGENFTDSAENFSVASFIFVKNIMFYALIYYLALLKGY